MLIFLADVSQSSPRSMRAPRCFAPANDPGHAGGASDPNIIPDGTAASRAPVGYPAFISSYGVAVPPNGRIRIRTGH
jgi:hypothetical protein